MASVEDLAWLCPKCQSGNSIQNPGQMAKVDADKCLALCVVDNNQNIFELQPLLDKVTYDLSSTSGLRWPQLCGWTTIWTMDECATGWLMFAGRSWTPSYIAYNVT